MNAKKINQIISRVVSIGILFVLMTPAINPAAAQAPAASIPWRDDFDGDTLDPIWEWINENPDKWSLSGGYLRIYTSPYPTGGENLLLRPVAPGDFVIETRLLFEPDTNFQIAGLVIYQDADNFFQLGRAYCDIPDVCVGNGIYFDKIVNGGGVDGNFAIPVNVPGEAFLRLELLGNQVRGFFSYEGVTWFELGTHALPPGFLVNGVGLTSAQDFFTPDTDVPADFDYFELTEGGGFLPEGFHDFDQGDVPNWACNAGGWAVDPDDRDANLWVEVVVDDVALPGWVEAGEYRPDLEEAGLCVGGTCGFFRAMWNEVSSYEPHTVTAYAQDIPSGDWVRLSASPKPLTCRTQDIYAYDPLTGVTTQVTDIRDGDEYNPSWSPNGKKVAHDVVNYAGGHGIYITDLSSGISAPLIGADDGGNDAAWSPNAAWIAFDRNPYGDPSLYLVQSAGGGRRFIRGDAVNADWAPNLQRLVFQQPSDGSIRTIHLKTGQETFVAANGANPVWSPNGKWIAYESEDDIWKVAVNLAGEPQSDPVRLTDSFAVDDQPTFSQDSKTIVYHSGNGRDMNIYSIPTAGGRPDWLTGGIEFGDYDPSIGRAKRVVAYSSFTPEGQAARDWVAPFTFDLPEGYWDEGAHSYHFEWGTEVTDEFAFDVSVGSPIYDGTVLLRQASLRTGEACDIISSIHPDEGTEFHTGLLENGKTYPEAVSAFDSLNARVIWDGGETAPFVRHEIYPWSSDIDWWGWVCSATQPPANRTVAVGNLRVEWSPTNPEEIISLRWKNGANLTNAWHHDACLGDLEYFGNSWVSENEGTPNFFFASLVGWSEAGTWLHEGKEIDIASKSTRCPASAEIPIHTDYQLSESPLKADLFRVERVFEFGGMPYDHQVRPFIPRLYPLDGFTQVIHPDASGTVLITETTDGCDFGCLVTDWNGAWFAIHNPTTGAGMIVLHRSSPYAVALWVDMDGGSYTNSSSVLLLQPPGGFTGDVTEVEYLYFYDGMTWIPSLRLPVGLSRQSLGAEGGDQQIFIPLIRR